MRTKKRLNKNEIRLLKLAAISYVQVNLNPNLEWKRGICILLETAASEITEKFYPNKKHILIRVDASDALWKLLGAFQELFTPTQLEKAAYKTERSFWFEHWRASGNCPCCHKQEEPDHDYKIEAHHTRLLALGFLRAMVLRGDI